MNDLEQLFGESRIRFVEKDGERWICANDCASVLEYANPKDAIVKFVNGNTELLEGKVSKFHTLLSTGRNQSQWYFNEQGLIMFLIKTGMPKAIPFQKWAVNVLHDAIKKLDIPVDKTLRLKSKKTRCDFTDTLKEHGISKPYEYIQLTYSTKKTLGIDVNKKKNNCNPLELCQIMMTETLSMYEIEANNLNGYYNIKPAVMQSGDIVKQIPMTNMQKAVE